MKRAAAVAAVLALLVPLSACSKAGATTCAEFGEMSYGDRDKTLDNLLRDHRLETIDLGNMMGVQEAVDGFCGTQTISGFEMKPATQNHSNPIDDAVDWDSPYW